MEAPFSPPPFLLPLEDFEDRPAPFSFVYVCWLLRRGGTAAPPLPTLFTVPLFPVPRLALLLFPLLPPRDDPPIFLALDPRPLP